jgi:hypothetical protein
MLHVFVGADREKARAALNAAVAKATKKGHIVRIADSNTLGDLDMALRGRGMFDAERAVVLDGILLNEEMRAMFEGSIERVAASEEKFFMLEEKPDAAARKLLEKHAEEVKKFDAAKKEREDNFFAFTNALRAGKKKELWVLLQQEYALGKAPEMLHGSLFWAAKQMVLRPRGSELARGKKLVASLAALPHEARRRGEDLEYALERFVLSNT